MTDHPQAMPDDRDDLIDNIPDEVLDGELELITSYLNGHLDPERVEAVRKRLEEDAYFRDLAAPLLLMWSVPKHLVRHPRPEGEWERAWGEFTKRAGFGQSPPAPPRSRWKRVWHWRGWKPLRVLVLLLVGAYWIGAQMTYSSLEDRRSVAPEAREYSVVPYDTGWIALNDGIEVRLTSGAVLSVDHRRVRSMKHVQLEGSARFRVWPYDSTAPQLHGASLLVDTRAGSVTAGESEFTVTARADTTVVLVHPLGPRRALEPDRMMVTATNELAGAIQHLPLRDLEGARLVLGRETERITNHR